MGATDDDSETPGWAAVPSPLGTVREVVRLVRRLPVRFDTLNPLSYLGSTAVTKTVTRTETRAATGEVLPEFFRTHEAAAILRLSACEPSTATESRGGGPAYFVFGNRMSPTPAPTSRSGPPRGEAGPPPMRTLILSGPKP